MGDGLFSVASGVKADLILVGSGGRIRVGSGIFLTAGTGAVDEAAGVPSFISTSCTDLGVVSAEEAASVVDLRSGGGHLPTLVSG